MYAQDKQKRNDSGNINPDIPLRAGRIHKLMFTFQKARPQHRIESA